MTFLNGVYRVVNEDNGLNGLVRWSASPFRFCHLEVTVLLQFEFAHHKTGQFAQEFAFHGCRVVLEAKRDFNE